jgi:hypothetical protein
LLTKGEDFDSDVRAALEEDARRDDQGENELEHGFLVLTRGIGTTAATASC